MDFIAALILVIGVLGSLLVIWSRQRSNQAFITYSVVIPSYGIGPNEPDSLFIMFQGLLFTYSKGRINPAKISFELVSNKDNGIVFLISAPIDLAQDVKDYLINYWPKLEISKVRDGYGFKLSNDLHVKIRRWQPRISLLTGKNEERSINMLLSGMQAIKGNDIAAFQAVISPYGADFLSAAVHFLLNLPLKIVKFSWLILSFFLTNQDEAVNRRLKRVVVKENNPDMLMVSFRSLAAADDKKQLRRLDLSLCAAIRSYGFNKKSISRDNIDYFIDRQHYRPIAINPAILSSIIYFPIPSLTLKEDIEVTSSPSLNISRGYKLRGKSEVILGINDFGSNRSAIGLSHSERQKHLLILGGTGMGKSTMLGYSIVQDMLSGRGLALIDPHGDLAQELIGFVPAQRISDVVYLDPSDMLCPIGINLMQLPPGLSPQQLEIAKDFVTEAIISIFRKIFSDDDSGGHRIEYILRNAIHTAFTVPGVTLFTIHKLLTNDSFRTSVVAKLSDDSLRDFWFGEFNKAGSYQRVKMISGVTAKLGRFQRSVVTRKILEQSTSTIDFDLLINEKKIIICNLSKGSIGEDTSSLLGMVILAKIQLTAWHRALIDEKKRRPFYVYVDEFQNFASSTLTQLISESRKYGLSLTLAEQTTANQSDKDSNIFLANIGNIVCFRTAASIDVKRVLHLFTPTISEADLNSLEPYRFYLRLSSETSNEPLSGETMLIKTKANMQLAKRVVANSKKLYGRKEEFYTANGIPEAQINKVPMKR